MTGIQDLTREDRRTIFRNTAQRMGIHEAVIEKDYWLCVVLDFIFHGSRYKEQLSFKGGTSLSKCFGLIRRFSEDIDLVLDWRLLGYDMDEPWQERSKTKQAAFNKEVNIKTEEFLASEFLPHFVDGLSAAIGEEADAHMDRHEPQTISFRYPRMFSSQSLLQSLRLEIGALAAWTPTVEKSISPFVYSFYPNASSVTSTSVITSTAERTFWEKATILHHEANRPEHIDMPLRYSRHYYDLCCMERSEHKQHAFAQLDLLGKVRDFKMKFYPRPWAKYEEAFPGSMRLMPPESRLKALRNDYESMKEMLYGEYPSFDEMMFSIRGLESEINRLRG